MNKIKEKLIEPAELYADSIFKVKIKTIRYATYEELKQKQYGEISKYTYSDLKGE